MRTLLRCLNDHRQLWRIWLPLLLLAALQPLVAQAMPLLERRLIDVVLLGKRLDLLPSTAALYGGLWLLGALMMIPNSVLRTYLAERMSVQLQRRLFAHTEALSLAFARREHSGRTTALFANDVPRLAGLFSSTVTFWVSNAIGVVLGVGIMFRLNAHLALATAILPLAVAGVAAMVTRPLRGAARRVQEKAAETAQGIHENLAGLREIVAFGQGGAQGRRFATTLDELLRLRMRVAYMDRALQTGQTFFGLTVTLVILVYGGYLVIQGKTTIGTLVAMRTLFNLIVYPAGQFLGLFSTIQKALGAADRVYAFLDERPQVAERPGARRPGAVRGEVAFEGVGFGYRPDRPVLRDITFAAQPGELVALVGPSGAGKSTLVSLLARFYDPDEGRILLDGADLRDLTLAGLRAQVGMVFQDTFLFAATIRENIAFGRAGAAEAEIVAAARAAHAWEFIELLPEGLDTLVGERGVRLSEGQKQRIAIARALLRDPRILILDEPTSALDARSEQVLQAALDNLMRGRTTFVIAHRLATVRRADRILALDGGRIVEQGAHAELLARRGLYRELFDLQFGGDPLAAGVVTRQNLRL